MGKKLLAISNHGSFLGGGEYSFRDLVFNLPESWRSIAVFPNKGELVEKFKAKKIETRVVRTPSIRPWQLANMYKSYRDLYRLGQKYKPNLIYANGSRAAFYGGLIGRKLKIPTIWHCRITNRDPYLDPILAKLCTCIIANSKATSKRFRPKYINKVSVVYNGIDYDWFNTEIKNRPEYISNGWKVILVAARISKWKRHDLVMNAFEKLAEKEPEMHLICIGAKDTEEPEWWRYLMGKTNRSKYKKRIHWMGQVDDVRPWYRAAEMLVLSSESEPFGRVIVEAMAMGLPVIASREGGVTEIITDNENGILTSPGNDNELASSIKKVLENETLRNRIISGAKKRAKEFDLKMHVEKMIKIFNEIITNNR